MRLAGIWVNSNAWPSQAGPSVKRGLKGPATISNSHAIVSPKNVSWITACAQNLHTGPQLTLARHAHLVRCARHSEACLPALGPPRARGRQLAWDNLCSGAGITSPGA